MTARQNFYDDPNTILGPMGYAADVTLHDPAATSPPGVDSTLNPQLDFIARGIWCNTAGVVALVLKDMPLGTAVLFTFAAKTLYKDLAIKQILFTGTTATGIKVLQ